MPELRWILLLVGAVAVLGIYLWSRRRVGAERERDSARREPVLEQPRAPWEALEHRADPLPPPEPESSPEDEAGGGEEQLIIVLRVRARSPEGFPGASLAETFAQEGLEHGRLGAFHSLDPRGQSRFMVASLTEPGSFDPEAMAGQVMHGVSLFMVLPGPVDPPGALDAMLGFARRTASRLDGEVLDENGNALTPQEAAYLREKVVEYWRRVRVGGGIP